MLFSLCPKRSVTEELRILALTEDLVALVDKDEKFIFTGSTNVLDGN